MTKRYIWFIIWALFIGFCLFAWQGGWIGMEDAQRARGVPCPGCNGDSNGNGGNGNGGNGLFGCGDTIPPPYKPASGDTYYVDDNGDDNRTKTQAKNYSTPWATIQNAIDSVTAGDWIIVQDGIYQDNEGLGSIARFDISGNSANWIILKSENLYGAKIDGENFARDYGIEINGSYIWIEGFEVYNVYESGLYCHNNQGHIYLYHNKIHSVCKDSTTAASGKSGINTRHSNRDITIDGNIIYNIGRIPSQSDPLNDIFYKNDHGIYAQGIKIRIINNIFYACSAGFCLKTDGNDFDTTGYTHYVMNNTFAYPGNRHRPGHVRIYKNPGLAYPPRILFQNNTFFEPPMPPDSNDQRHCIELRSNTIKTVAVNCITTVDSIFDMDGYSKDSSEVINCITNANIYFVDTSINDFHLTDSSDCIDAGADLDGEVPDYDMDMWIRPIGDTVDVGAYEYCGGLPAPPAVSLIYPPNDTTLSDSLPYFDWTDIDTSYEIDKYNLLVDTVNDFGSIIINDTVTVSTDTVDSPLDDDTYYWKVRGHNASGWGLWSEIWNFNINTYAGGKPLYQNFEEGKDSTGETDVTVQVPSGTAVNDLLIAIHISNKGGWTHSAHADWTVIQESNSFYPGDSEGVISVYYRICDGTEPGSYTFTVNSTKHAYAMIIRFTDANTSNPIDVWKCGEGMDSLPMCPDTISTVDSCLVLRLFGADDDDITIDGGYPDGHTGIGVDQTHESASYSVCGGAAYKYQNSAGSVGADNFYMLAQEEWAGYTIIIKP